MKKAKGKEHESGTSDHRRSEPRGDDKREPKRTRTDLPSPIVRFSQSVFDDDTAAARLFATLVFPDDPHTRVRASSSGTMSRVGLKFLAFVNRVDHELEAEIEKQKCRADNHANGERTTRTERDTFADQLDKRIKSLRRHSGNNARLRPKNEKLTKELETAKQDARNSLTFLTRRNEQADELKKQVEQRRKLLKTARDLILDLHEKFAIAKAKFAKPKGDPQDKMIFQVQREANLDFVKQLLGLLPERKVPKLEDALTSLTADVEANACDEEYFERLMESFEECLNVVLLAFAKPTLLTQDKPLETLAPEAGVKDVSGSRMSLENVGGLLQEMRIGRAGLLKNLMISEDERMPFAMTAAEDTKVEKNVAETEEKMEPTATVTSAEVAKDKEVHP
ncbi:hypothetical protein AALP_AA1G155500 [Arabis alpina]|uniref:Uncharacterized protein n=1 Tax=Arabis alpina TaxID=50452 RepID=A0A087HNF5_ARAAL|nr:hypothetical protein AALP_AA1G155500 [Arabis alpina]